MAIVLNICASKQHFGLITRNLVKGFRLNVFAPIITPRLNLPAISHPQNHVAVAVARAEYRREPGLGYCALWSRLRAQPCHLAFPHRACHDELAASF